MKVTKRQLRQIIRGERARLLREDKRDVQELADEVQMIIDRDGGDIFTMADKLKVAGYNDAEYLAGAGMRMIQIPYGGGQYLVIISKNAVEPDANTIIVGPYAVGIMG